MPQQNPSCLLDWTRLRALMEANESSTTKELHMALLVAVCALVCVCGRSPAADGARSPRPGGALMRLRGFTAARRRRVAFCHGLSRDAMPCRIGAVSCRAKPFTHPWHHWRKASVHAIESKI